MKSFILLLTMKFWCALVAFLFSVTVFGREQVHFDLFLFGNKIGTMTVSKHVSGDTVHYFLESYSKAKVLWMNYEDVTYMKVKYVKAKLHSAYYKEDMNQKLKYLTDLSFDGTQYTVTTKNGTRNIIPDNYPSLLSLYFTEPLHTPKIYFEAQLFATPIEKKAPSHYVFKTKEGNENEYIYRNGKLDELILHTSIATVKMKRVNRD